jgi:hypothetical protein
LFIVKQKLMKKFSIVTSALLLFAVIGLLFMACQKEQAAVTTDEANSENTNIKRTAGSGGFQGSIDGSYAASLARNFEKKYDEDNQVLRVAFSAKDLAAFIAGLQTKQSSDIIYVNFGVYGKGAPAPNPKNNGRMTVFFTGNNLQRSTGNQRTDGTTSDESLNHGDLLPIPPAQ